MSYANLEGGRAQLPCNFQNETWRQGWWWQLNSLVQMSLTFLFHLWHAICSFPHWSSLPVWITQSLLWAVRLSATVSLIRGKISLVTFWRKQGIWRNSLKILHLTKWMVLKIIAPALQLPLQSHHSSPVYSQPCKPVCRWKLSKPQACFKPSLMTGQDHGAQPSTPELHPWEHSNINIHTLWVCVYRNKWVRMFVCMDL